MSLLSLYRLESGNQFPFDIGLRQNLSIFFAVDIISKLFCSTLCLSLPEDPSSFLNKNALIFRKADLPRLQGHHTSPPRGHCCHPLK